MILSIILLIVGFALLTKGSSWLVNGASDLARKLGVSEFIIGITIVAVGTSLPEFAASVYSSFAGFGDLAVSNVLGSNITNIALVVGLAAIISKIKFGWKIAKRDLVLLLGSAFICVPVMMGGQISKVAGGLLILIYIAYVVDLIFEYRNKKKKKRKKINKKIELKDLLLVTLGGIGVVIGARLTIYSAVDIATVFGISNRIIGLTLIALGTSLPELATSIMAGLKHKGAMVLGNIAGSNAFNILLVLGASSLVRTITVNPLTLTVDLPLMIIASLFFLFIWDRDISRFEGIVLLSFYITYLVVIFSL